MGRPQRYLFDVSFDQPEPDPAARPVEPTFTRAELEAARAEAAEAARAAALAEAAAADEKRAADALQVLGEHMGALVAARAALARATEDQAVAVLRAVLRKALPALCRKDPLAEIEDFVTACLGEVMDEPRLVLRVSDRLFDAVQQRIAGIIRAGAYGGKVALIADAALADGDGRVEWADGGAERDSFRLIRDIDAVLARTLDAPPPPNPSEETDDGRDPEPAAR